MIIQTIQVALSRTDLTVSLDKHSYEDEELEESRTCKNYLQVQTEGKRQINRNLKHYSLMIWSNELMNWVLGAKNDA